MYTIHALIEDIDNEILDLTDEEVQGLRDCDTCVSVLRTTIQYLQKNNDPQKICFFNKLMIIHLSSIQHNYNTSYDFIKYADASIWNYVFENFDDDKLNSLIIIIYLVISKRSIQVEQIIKIYKIMFSDFRMADFLVETEIFFSEETTDYTNAYKTLLGLLINKISLSIENYESRIIKMTELFYILLKNRVVKDKFLIWCFDRINKSKNFKNNFLYSEYYSRDIIHGSYFKVLLDIFLKLWDDAKNNKEKNKFENINMNYLKNTKCFVDWEEKTMEINTKNRIFNDIFYFILNILNVFYNNLDFIICEYDIFLDDAHDKYKYLKESNSDRSRIIDILDIINSNQIELDILKNINLDNTLNIKLKNFQKDIADIINLNLKINNDILDCVLETNIDLINTLKLFDDSYYNYNYINFENSVILFNWEKLRNPFIRNKYCTYSSYYVVDNTSRNVFDLRYKFIENNLIPNLISFYIDLEDLQDESFYDKEYARSNIINFINFICFKEPYLYAEQLSKYTKSKDKKFIRFINLYINDLSVFFDDTFSLIKKINEIEGNSINISYSNSIICYLKKPLELDLYKKYKTLENFVNNLKFMFSFLLILTEYSSNTLMSKELGDKFCSQINYYINELTSKEKRKTYKIKNNYDVGFIPLNILNVLIKIIINLLSHKRIKKCMATDQRSFKKKNILFAIDKLWSNHLITENEYKRLQILGEEVEKKIIEDKEEDIPDEFCDPLMACEIMEPVFLPGTNTIMEKSIISRHLLTDQHNPFNREQLTMDILEEYNSKNHIREKIEVFLKKKNDWKNTN